MQQNQLASVNYRRLAQLKKHTGTDNNLWLVYDALVFSWQNSKIVQKGKKLCCPTISRIAELANVSTRTVLRKLKILEQMGLVSSFTKRLRNGTVRRFFNVCIEKISSIVNLSSKESQNALEPSIYAGSDKLSHPEVTDCHFHIYKEKTVKEKNNINNNTATPESNEPLDQQNAVDVNFVADAQVDVALPNSQVAKAASPEEKIGDTLTKRQHCRINGAINNLIRKEGVRISDPKGLKAQVAFKILLKSDKSGGSNFQHQLNAAMKLILEGKWSTPHGYYNHSDEGRVVKTATGQQEKEWKELKRQERQSSGFAALAAACQVDDQVNTDAENELVALRPEPAMTSTDRVLIDGQLVLKSDAKVRLDSINENIGRYLERAKTMPDNLRAVVMCIVGRLRGEIQEITCALS